jgi:putative methionine-R-sulfoxide reductase with GAF domain
MDYEKATQKLRLIINIHKENAGQPVVDYLQSSFDTYSWVGIYLVKNNTLILGPWKGPHATEHTEIPIGQGICGAAVKTGKTENIADVRSDDRYLSCFVSTRAELVVPIKHNNEIIGEIDIDSDTPHAFTKEDESFLEKIADMLSEHIHNK